MGTYEVELRHVKFIFEPGAGSDRALHEARNYENKVYVLPKHLNEKTARLHVEALGAHLTTLRPEQAEYVNVPVEGPYKADHYRY